LYQQTWHLQQEGRAGDALPADENGGVAQ